MTNLTHVGVLGGGRMGAGIAHAFVMAGCQVTVVERDAEAARAAQERVSRSIDASVSRGLADDADALRGALHTATDPSAFAGHELVIEAVPEDVTLKREALARVEAALAPIAVLASNTSSISLSLLTTALTRPAQFIGLHFFNPVPASTLVEIVVAEGTADDLPERAANWVRLLGKTPITVTDSPGFASSRLGVALALEAMRMLEEGVASATDIDTAMELGYRHPQGPLKTTDLVGLDVRLAIAEQLERDLGPRFTPPRILRQLVTDGHLGRKTGRGFYDWSDAP